MRVIMGLGEPGGRYEKTRRNAGFRVIDELAIRWGVQLSQYEWSSRLGRGTRLSYTATDIYE